jgi:hypothetical protein
MELANGFYVRGLTIGSHLCSISPEVIIESLQLREIAVKGGYILGSYAPESADFEDFSYMLKHVLDLEWSCKGRKFTHAL